MFKPRRTIKLLPSNSLRKTGEVDHADWNYRFVLGYIQRKRFLLILKLLGNSRYDNLLEIGYGSGVFIPQLAEYSQNIFGIDIHNKNESIMKTLLKYHIKSNLFSASVEEMPFGSNFFDALISVSALEFVENLDAACMEIKRVLKKDGNLFVVTPGYSKILDFGLKVLTGKNAQDDYGDKRQRMIPALSRHFKIKREIVFPIINFGIKIYTAFQLTM